MRRVDRIRLERRRRLALVFGLAFTLGALTSGGLIWRADSLAADAERRFEAASEAPASRPTDAGPGAMVSAAPAPTTGSAEISGFPGSPKLGTSAGGRRTSDADATRLLRMKRLDMPLDGVSRDRLQDTFDDGRAAGLRRHEAIDIMAPAGTPVRAVEDARVAKLFKSVAGGLTIYLEDPSKTFIYYYAHLDGYAPGLKEDQHVRRGELIGFVGSTGNASEDAPHLHFAIFQMGPERRWWQGDPINPFPILR